MPFWTRERDAGIWDFKGKADDLPEQEQTCGKQIFLGHTETMDYKGKSNKQVLLIFSLSAIFGLYYDAKVILPSLKQMFLSGFF